MTRDELRVAGFVSECRIECDRCHDPNKTVSHIAHATEINTISNLRLCYGCYCKLMDLSDQRMLEKVGLR